VICIDENESQIVARLSMIMAQRCNIPHVVIDRIGVAAILHDCGKRKIPNEILNKPGKLNVREFEIMKTHTKQGADMLTNIEGDLGEMVRNVCLYHHEKWDGSGYWGKYSSELPIYVPIVAIADVFVALCSTRIYKDAWPLNEAVDYIKQQSGTQFSPAFVELFIETVRHDESLPVIFSSQKKPP
jgi:HD-GYP domain-containing protein (c-di-GMP phosphodiesterase class II)